MAGKPENENGEGRDVWIRLMVKFKGKCKDCGKEIVMGEYALWSRKSKAIKHITCSVESAYPSSDRAGVQVEASLLLPKLDCFICRRSVSYNECGINPGDREYLVLQEAKTERAQIPCICDTCMADRKVYDNYQAAFSERLSDISQSPSRKKKTAAKNRSP